MASLGGLQPARGAAAAAHPEPPTGSRPRSSGSRMARPARGPLLNRVGRRPLVSERVSGTQGQSRMVPAGS